ncbi:D-2-hydroxyacid dehydrogenase [Thalassotalea sp. LPB0316]|uniref:D-2-hydroxyacid dehydrogenase n=1 Tax=Thalassotalea sp. LPB0316 TaxID=2769490 RepID=UPI00186835A2|nr:D-2-hydroxyacid dehydrogenase [Thalassotalea sp. LPB0316]QOL25713.1 D-2-hydroxyacid dehydrogenase [Thalassotalea sp. LPB0316]
MRAVFLDSQTFHPTITFEAIEQVVDTLTYYPLTQPDEIIERAKDAQIIITNKVILTESILSKLPELKLICISATGTNNVDLVAARRLGITVTNVSGYAKQAVSQYVMAQLLNYYCRLASHNQVTTNQTWQQSPTFCVHGQGMTELSGKTFGILGYGSLGQAVARLAHAFGMQVLVAERPNASVLRADRVSFEDMLSRSDIVSLHCPQTSETTGLFNQTVFEQMKPNAVLINTARGGIVNSLDLAQALKSNTIAHAIVDVLEQEPPPSDHPLLDNRLKNITITAHMAWASFEAQQRLLTLLAKNIADYQQGIATNVVN